MSRPLRIEFAGAVYHVTLRGNGRKPIFRNDQDRLSFLEVLHKVNQRYHWFCQGPGVRSLLLLFINNGVG